MKSRFEEQNCAASIKEKFVFPIFNEAYPYIVYLAAERAFSRGGKIKDQKVRIHFLPFKGGEIDLEC